MDTKKPAGGAGVKGVAGEGDGCCLDPWVILARSPS